MTSSPELVDNQTHGLVCAHHHLYSALARGMPAPPKTPTGFVEILEQVWWRLDRALDEDTIYWSAKLGALEALESGCTAVIDHHESPNAIDGSLSIIADACAEVGVRVSCSYGVTDRHGAEGAKQGLAENDRFLSEGGRGYVGIHAAFTCSDDTLAAAADIAKRHGVGVHIHVAEGEADAGAADRIRDLTNHKWLLVHGVHLADDHGLEGTIVHNPRSNMNNQVGYARPTRFTNPTGLGTDGIGADMFDEFRIAYVKLREHDVTETPDTAAGMLATNTTLFREVEQDRITWNYRPVDPWRLAFTPAVRPSRIERDGVVIYDAGTFVDIDADEIRAKAAEAALRLFAKLDEIA